MRLARLQRLLVDDPGVRVEPRAHQPLAGPPEGADHHLVDAPGVRVGGEQDAARPRLDHALDDHARRRCRRAESPSPAGSQGPLVVGRGPDLADRFQDLLAAADEEEAVVQPRERLPRRVLPRRRGADGHVGSSPSIRARRSHPRPREAKGRRRSRLRISSRRRRGHPPPPGARRCAARRPAASRACSKAAVVIAYQGGTGRPRDSRTARLAALPPSSDEVIVRIEAFSYPSLVCWAIPPRSERQREPS